MNGKSQGDFHAWHELFDSLCEARGWADNNALASQLCRHLGKQSRQDFEAAKKKLRMWRTGRRLPLRRNLAALAQLLDVASDPQLDRQWSALYRRATLVEQAGAPQQSKSQRGLEGWWASRNWTIAGLALLLGSGAAYAMISSNRQVAFDALPLVNFEGYVRVPVGASRLIHGALKGCGVAPDWEEIEPTLPASAFGVFSDGGLARKVVRRCHGETLVRAVRFTGIAPGTSQLRLLDAFIRVDVVTLGLETPIAR